MLNKNLLSGLLSRWIHPLAPIPTGMRRSGALDRPLEGILFDVYGTLFISDSGDIGLTTNRIHKEKSLLELLHRYEIERPLEALLKRFFNTIHATHETLKAKGVDFPEVEIDRIWMQVLENDDINTVRAFAVEFEFLVNRVYPMPHLKELLSGCAKRKVLMGIISNAQFYTPLLFDLFLGLNPEGLGFVPDLVFFSYRFGYAKPSRFLYDMAARQLHQRGISPDAVLYVGNDILNDISPAKAVGFKTALFAGDARSLRLRKDDRRCSHVTADLVITDLIQLLKYP
jgi:putative hydrolase of the HAD superfamily